MPDHLFVYGTLHPDRAPAELADLVAQFVPRGHATIQGHILHLGTYPGLILDDRGPAVTGQVFLLPTNADLWFRLDAYEDYRAHDEAASLFLRRQTVVNLADSTPLLCWIYLYNRTLLTA